MIDFLVSEGISPSCSWWDGGRGRVPRFLLGGRSAVWDPPVAASLVATILALPPRWESLGSVIPGA